MTGWDCSQCNETFDIALIGDLVLGSRLMRSRFGANKGVALRYFGKFLTRLQEADAVFANFEGCVYERSRPRDKGLTEHFTLGFTRTQAAFLSDLHPNLVLSLSNNHIADYGHEGIQETTKYLDEHHIQHAGVGDIESAVRFVRVKNATIAFAAFTDMLPERFYSASGAPCVSRATEENIHNAIEYARKSADLVFVSLHIMANFLAPAQFTPDAHQERLAAVARDAGADVVFGHHPHRLQSFGKIHNAFVFHGLGPFLYDPAISSIVHKSSRLYDAVQIGGGGIAVLQCCKHVVRSARIFPTRTVERPDGGFLVLPATFLQNIRMKIALARTRC